MIKKIDPESKQWEKLANELAREQVQLAPCGQCNHPVVVGYRCTFCGSSSPRNTESDEE